MGNLKKALNEIQILCWTTRTEDEIEQKVQDYLKEYPHLHNAACIDLLRECVKTWFRIKMIEKLIDNCVDDKDKLKLLSRLERTTEAWLKMLGNLGITFTRVQYKGKKADKVMPPFERLKMLNPKAKEAKNDEE